MLPFSVANDHDGLYKIKCSEFPSSYEYDWAVLKY